MIDTVGLKLDGSLFKKKINNQFNNRKYTKGKGYIVDNEFCREFVKNMEKQGNYCPQVTLHKTKAKDRGLKEVLETQVSITKMTNETNLFEIGGVEDLNVFYKKFHLILDQMGIITTIDNLKMAIVKRVDFSKVIILPDYLGKANDVIYRIWRFNYKPSSEFSVKEFNDGSEGICLKFYNKTQGYSIYCKFSEIYSNGKTTIEKKLNEHFINKKNAIKFELSLERKNSMEAVLRRRINGKKKNFLLSDVVNKELSKSLLLENFDKIFNNIAFGLISLADMKDNELLAYLDKKNLTLAKKQKLYYWVHIATKCGMAGVMRQLKEECKGGSVATNKKEIKSIIAELGEIKGNMPNLIEFLRQEHEKFEILKLK